MVRSLVRSRLNLSFRELGALRKKLAALVQAESMKPKPRR
jgi:hypothetical protein